MNGTVPFPLPASNEAYDASEDEIDEAGALRPGRLLLLFVPFLLAWSLEALSLVSYAVAWSGSLWVLWLTVGGHVRPLPGEAGALDQLLRPVVLTQVLFVFYTCLSSVFYVADLYGYYYLSNVSALPVRPEEIAAAAQAQRYYVLAHAGMAAGIVAAMDYSKSAKWVVRPLQNPARVLFLLSVLTFVAAQYFGVRNQLGTRLADLSLVSAVLVLTLAFAERRVGWVLVGSVMFAGHLASAFLSGWKEEVLVMFVLLAVFMYPYARKVVLVGTPITLVFLLAILPAYVNTIRDAGWSGRGADTETATAAVDAIRAGEVSLAETNWAFLTGRLSEIGLFTRYIDRVGAVGGYYGTEIAEQALLGVVPRALWSEKPNMEVLVMDRVYSLGIVADYSNVSAKPQYVVDGFLSFGVWGVLLASLVYGLIASWASQASERWFGGYLWGSGLVYTSMFSILWRGNSFEFFFPAVFWSFVLLIPLFFAGRAAGLLVRADELEEDPDCSGDIAEGA